jgi:hypothetical protein
LSFLTEVEGLQPFRRDGHLFANCGTRSRPRHGDYHRPYPLTLRQTRRYLLWGVVPIGLSYFMCGTRSGFPRSAIRIIRWCTTSSRICFLTPRHPMVPHTAMCRNSRRSIFCARNINP